MKVYSHQIAPSTESVHSDRFFVLYFEAGIRKFRTVSLRYTALLNTSSYYNGEEHEHINAL